MCIRDRASRAPRIFGDVTLHVSQVDAIVESDRYPAALSPQPPDEVEMCIRDRY